MNSAHPYPIMRPEQPEHSLLDTRQVLSADGNFDLILDDGSHVLEHQALTANTLIPKLLSEQACTSSRTWLGDPNCTHS